MKTLGLNLNGHEQIININGESIKILDQIKLSPLDYANMIDKSDSSTYTVHQFGQTWADAHTARKRVLKKIILTVIGGRVLKSLRALIKR